MLQLDLFVEVFPRAQAYDLDARFRRLEHIVSIYDEADRLIDIRFLFMHDEETIAAWHDEASRTVPATHHKLERNDMSTLKDDPKLFESLKAIEEWLARPNGPVVGTGIILALAVDSAALHSGCLAENRLPTPLEVEKALLNALEINVEALRIIEDDMGKPS